MDYAAIVLAGGGSSRMGGALKPLLTLGGVPLLDRVLSAVAAADPVVVVGPSEVEREDPVIRVREDPPGGGPVAAIEAGLAACGEAAFAAVVAADLPFVTPQSLRRLWHALAAHPSPWQAAAVPGGAPATAALNPAAGDERGAACAVYVDGEGRRQPMVAMWHTSALRAALALGPAAGRSMRSLMARRVVDVRWHEGDPPPWYDCDTPQALREAERWA